MRPALLAFAAIGFAPMLTRPASAQMTLPEFRTIGAPGNAPASPDHFPFLAIDGWGPVGQVNYEYRLARTELTVAQYFEFARAYVQFHPEAARDRGFTGFYIVDVGEIGGPPELAYPSGAANYPADMSWHYAARVCNWLTNNQANTAAAFESGAYDTITFTQNANGTWNGQATHTPGAQYWIPTIDEAIKGLYYDPNRAGPNQYWLYPHSSDTAPVGGTPGTPGAQTGAGDYPRENPFQDYDVGSYPDAQSPWGLLDGSGGRPEHLELQIAEGRRVRRGTGNFAMFPQFGDRLDVLGHAAPTDAGAGLRLASNVPSPGSIVVVLVGLLCRRRSRCNDCLLPSLVFCHSRALRSRA